MPLRWYLVCQDCGHSIDLSCKWEALEHDKCEECGGYNLKTQRIRIVDLDKKREAKPIWRCL